MPYLKLITPTNIAEEKEKFFASDAYSPQFEYAWDESLIAACKAASPALGNLADALPTQDKDKIEPAAKLFLDVEYRPQDLAFAKELVGEVPTESNGTAEDLAAAMTAKLKVFGIDYTVKIVDEHGFQCRPQHKKRILTLSKYLHLQFYPTESVANHELVHIIRAVNGKENGIVRRPDYLATEEGLSCLIQDKLLRTGSASAFQHALEYLASYVAKDAGFREVYNFFLDHGCDPENAWLRGIRQKFGYRDTSLPGSLMKSGMYFYHEQLLRELNTESLVRLFVGKIPLSELDDYPEYIGIVPEEKIRILLET